jgi:hypothetical protein
MNQTYKAAGPYKYTSEPVSEATLTESRAKALELVKAGEMVLRSCWVCNSAHVRLIEGEGVVLNCFECGHYYLGGVDVTELES